ncbi:MAG: hypothetical protein L0Z53_15810 [Acidobacteriales bacterium]|nr:hypothetical protein [Terriglobales bacterium]
MQTDRCYEPDSQNVGTTTRRRWTITPGNDYARRQVNWRFLVLVALAFFLVSPELIRAQGGPPLLTDDPGTPGPGRWEINVAVTAERDKSSWLLESPLLDLNYGWGERIQLKFEVPWIVQQGPQGTQTALGSSLMGVKWRFYGDEKSPLALSVYPQLTVNNPGPAARLGLVDHGTQMLLPMEIVYDVGPIKLNAEIGLNLQSRERNQWIYGLAFGRDITDKFEIIGEVHDVSSTNFRENELVFNVGGRRKLSGLTTLLFSFGRSLPGATNSVPHFLVYTGVQFHF